MNRKQQLDKNRQAFRKVVKDYFIREVEKIGFIPNKEQVDRYEQEIYPLYKFNSKGVQDYTKEVLLPLVFLSKRSDLSELSKHFTACLKTKKYEIKDLATFSFAEYMPEVYIEFSPEKIKNVDRESLQTIYLLIEETLTFFATECLSEFDKRITVSPYQGAIIRGFVDVGKLLKVKDIQNIDFCLINGFFVLLYSRMAYVYIGKLSRATQLDLVEKRLGKLDPQTSEILEEWTNKKPKGDLKLQIERKGEKISAIYQKGKDEKRIIEEYIMKASRYVIVLKMENLKLFETKRIALTSLKAQMSIPFEKSAIEKEPGNEIYSSKPKIVGYSATKILVYGADERKENDLFDLGGKWNKNYGGWVLPKSKRKEASKIVGL